MITVIVRIKLPKGMTRKLWLEHARRIADGFLDVPGLIRKNFILGDDGYGGGIYTWASREAAEDFYAGPWRDGIVEMFGTEPEITYFESPVIVDNDAGKVTVRDDAFNRAGKDAPAGAVSRHASARTDKQPA